MSHNPTYKVLNSNLFFNPKLPHLILKKKKIILSLLPVVKNIVKILPHNSSLCSAFNNS